MTRPNEQKSLEIAALLVTIILAIEIRNRCVSRSRDI